MACCLTSPSHYPNQCWLLINEVLWQSPESNCTSSAQASVLYCEFENYALLSHIPRINELKVTYAFHLIISRGRSYLKGIRYFDPTFNPVVVWTWWRHQMETFPCYWPFVRVTGEFPSHRSATRSFDVFFDLRLNKRLSKQSRRRWFETTSR